MNYYVGIMKTIDEKKDKEIREEHIAYLNTLIEQGKILAKGPFTDGSGGLIIFLADSWEEAESLADQDPVVKENTREMTLREWRSNLSIGVSSS
ncbi:YciI family protein [Ammoniphilus sp. CFH 90114]|uniref:YciI family protein n=1 Tax=Ammoniphilus sp. CFH 90114 TaxID=2493665 RepID=UPI00100EC965|nr:YciI family protein [Ammoniphilus sp. CFH 90114]RXT05781.1 hypothetical protein EIZ39_16895 [Ammoniphilus sp. CFH 90114]